MAFIKDHFECDRCGKKIVSSSETLCPKCNKWLQDYISKIK